MVVTNEIIKRQCRGEEPLKLSSPELEKIYKFSESQGNGYGYLCRNYSSPSRRFLDLDVILSHGPCFYSSST
jgi:hypothetical protein